MVNRKRAATSANKATYREAINQAYEELSELIDRHEALTDELDAINWKIDDLKMAVTSMGKLCGVDPEKERPELFPDTVDPDMGFTDAVREVFRAWDGMLDPIGVRNRLIEMKFPISKYKAPLASIHTILKRLVNQGDLELFSIGDGDFRYGAKDLSERVKKKRSS